MKRVLLVSFLGVCACLGGLLGSAAHLGSPVRAHTQPPPSPGPPAPAEDGLPAPAGDVLALSDRFEQIARRTAPAVVSIEASHPARPAPGGRGRLVEESGSGVLVRFPGRAGYY